MVDGEESASVHRWFGAALAAVEPAAAVRRALACAAEGVRVGGEWLDVGGRMVLLSVGKAAVAMARGAVEVCGDRLDEGVVITKDGQATAGLPSRLVVYSAAHPIPDERGEAATREALRLVGGLEAGEGLVALISGGGSALLEAPRPPITLGELATTTDLLLRAGAPIEDLNAVRWCLSRVKAGGVRRAAGAATVATLILSDVLGNDPMVIASGPTVAARTPSRAAARAVLERYGVGGRVPASVVALLAGADDDRGGERAVVGADRFVVVGDNRAAVDAAAAAAAVDGRRVVVAWRDRAGEAAEMGRAWVETCRAAPRTVDVLVGGGEATVTVRGRGVGGRNTEFALAAAMALAESGESEWLVASLATDGEDGPTGAAGAIADSGMVARSVAAGVDPAVALAENDSLRVFEVAGGVVRTGPTGTNVNDLYFAVRVG